MAKDQPPTGLRYFNLGPWPNYIGFTTSRRAFRKEMQRLCPKENIEFLRHERAQATTHLFVNKGRVCQIICMEPFDRKRQSRESYAALLAHEAMHVVEHMREELSRGASLGSEAEAYLIQQIVQEGLQTAWKSNRARRTEPK